MSGARFPKAEKLKSRKAIESLMSQGQRLQTEGLVVLWLQVQREEGEPLLRAAFSAPKKRLPRAVDRNLVKRRLREAFRLNRQRLMEIIQADNICLDLMFIYQSKGILPYSQTEVKLVLLLNDLCAKVHEKHN